MMTALEELDRQIATATPDDQAKLNARRCDLLESLAAAAKDPVEREQWIRNLGDTVGAAAQVGSFPEGIDRLKHLEESLAKNKEDDSLFAFIQYRRMQAEYSVEIQSPKADPQKIQQAWLEKLETFVKDHPAASDASEAMLQIAIANEFAGEDEAAEKWYTRLVKDFPESNAGKKGAGALRRLGSVGKVLPLKGTTMLGNKVALSQYKGQMVLIQYWATWCEPCLKDMDEIKELQAKYAKQFAVLGVNLDNDAEQAKRFAKSEKLPWHNLYEPGGLDSRLAVEMGILTLPTLILVDEKGQVINRNIHAGELAGELRKLNVADQRRALK